MSDMVCLAFKFSFCLEKNCLHKIVETHVFQEDDQLLT